MLILLILVGLIWNDRQTGAQESDKSQLSAPLKQEMRGVVTTQDSTKVVKNLIPEVFYRVVVRGDTLTKIARESCNTIGDIATENHISDINVIYVHQTLTLKKVEPCSPVLAKLKTSPENVLQSQRGASREKSLSPDSAISSLQHAGTQRTNRLVTDDISPVESVRNCATVAWRIKDNLEKLRINAKCIEEMYGEIIRDAIREVDTRIAFYDVIAIIIIESKGNPLATNSETDCHGLMQLQSPTARGFGVAHVYNPRENIFGGVRVLSNYIFEKFGGSRAHGIAGYNMGPYSKYFKGHNDPNKYWYVRDVERIRAILEPLPPVSGEEILLEPSQEIASERKLKD